MSSDLTPEAQEIIYQKIMTMTLSNDSISAMARDNNVSRPYVRKIQDSERFKDELEKAAKAIQSEGRSRLIASVSDLVPEAHRVLKEKLKANDLQAVKLVFQAVGLDQKDQVASQANLTVVLPSTDTSILVPNAQSTQAPEEV